MRRANGHLKGERRRAPSEVEPVRDELARIRARFGLDPASPSQPLESPWAPAKGDIEEDEAEFADAVADCLSAGLPLYAAVASWVSGSLACLDDDSDEDESEVRLAVESRIAVRRRSTVR